MLFVLLKESSERDFVAFMTYRIGFFFFEQCDICGQKDFSDFSDLSNNVALE